MSKRMKAAVVTLACVLTVVLSVPVMAWAALQTNYEWYAGHESDVAYTIGSAGQLAALAQLVNGTASYDVDGDGKADAIPADSFEGKTITLDGTGPHVLGFLGNPITPIGTKEHPFEGSFDGNGWEVANFTLAVKAADAGPVENVGVFGCVGSHGSIANLNVASSSSISIERDASSSDYITNVGMVVGFCAGTVENCGNAGALTVASEALQRSADDYIPVRNIGGVAGQCVYDMTGCKNTGAISVSETSSPVASIEHAQLAARVGGVVGLIGDESCIGTFDKHVFGEAAKHGSVRGCSNEGKVVIDTPKLSGLDRFGQQTNAESVAIGGVVGYSQGSVTDCVNGLERGDLADASYKDVGYIRAENGVMVGGVCGSLRGVMADNMNIAWADDGADGNDPLVVSGCVNYGDVYGRVTVGGVVGKTSSYTTVTGCLNACKQAQTAPGVYSEVETYVIATRWNKPAPGGIAGTANGVVSYCANLGTVASATWKDEANRTLNTQDGYYAAGIAGMLTYFDDQAASNGGMATPISEVFSCYNAGSIIAGSNMRQRGITGQNDGFTHDNVLVRGLVYDDELVYGDSDDEPEASGTVGENRLYSASELRGGKATEAIAFLNGNSEANGWASFWVQPRDNTAAGLNAGYPLLNTQNPWGADATSLADAVTALEKDAAYTGGESVPEATATLGGAKLTQNADFRVVPQGGAVEPSSGGTYRATVVGIGRYQGEAAMKVPYDIVAGSFESCTVTVVAHTFDFEEYAPKRDEVTVKTPMGTTVDPDEYTYRILDADGNAISPKDADRYTIELTPTTAGLKHFSGTLSGLYRIKPASFMREVKFDGTTISYLGQDYPWVDSKNKGESDNPSTTLPYTGVAVKPTVGKITYKGHALVEGADYKIVYGNSNSDDGYTGDQDANNMGKPGGTSIGCVTIRYVSGKKTNFTSYANMFFKISDTGAKTDLSKARAVVEGEQISDGNPLEPVEIWLGNTKLVKGADYTISYASNVYPGTASFTATGAGTFSGTLKGTFAIEEGSVYEFSYEYSGTGAAGSPFEATVTGVNYLSSRDSFDMAIPESVEHGGHAYSVVAIADKAFGGSGSDFAGSAENASKAKIASVRIPATVRTIGRYAFGTNDITMVSPPPVSAVEFADGSQLVEIGAYAFSRCSNLKSVTIPANVRTIGDNAFQSSGSGSGLNEIRFLTTSETMPQTVSSTAFRYCVGVTVRGHEQAKAVRAIADGNSSTARNGDNGGRGFTFKAFSPAAGLAVSDIAEQVYSGSAITPTVKVTLSGTALREGADYHVSYADNVNAGTATATVTGLGDYGFQVEKRFRITPCAISKVEFAPVADQVYSGSAVSVPARLSFGAMTLREGVDYTLSFASASGAAIAAPSAAGSYRVVATGTGNFSGTRYRAFRIVTASLANAEVTLGSQQFTGVAVEPDPQVRFGGELLERDRDYVLTYANNKAIGQASVTVHGMGGFSGEKTVDFAIEQASIADSAAAGVFDVWSGGLGGLAVSFAPVVVKDGVKLVEGVDFDVSYEKAASDSSGGAPAASSALAAASFTPQAMTAPAGVQAVEPGESIKGAPSEVGDYYLVVTGKGSYRATARFPFSICASKDEVPAKVDIGGASVTVGAAAYNGGYCKPDVTVALGGVQGAALEEGADYILAYDGNAAVGPATVTAYGIGSYSGSVQAGFSVAQAQISAGDVKPIADVPYTGAAIRPKVGVVVAGRSLVEGADYTVEYADNVNPGTATARVQGIGGYSGTVGVPFEISSTVIDLASASVSVPSAVYTGSPITPAVKVTLDGTELVAGSEYTVSFSNNTNAGEASYEVRGAGEYGGTVRGSFSIAPKPLSGAAVTAPSREYNGSPASPTVTVRLNGAVLKAPDYTVSYQKAGGAALGSSGMVDAGSYRVAVTGRGNYTGSASGSFTITPASLSGAIVAGLADATYTGSPIVRTPAVTVGGRKLALGTDFTFDTSDNVNAGVASVTVKGTGNYTGSASGSFTIKKASQSISAKNVKKTYKGKKSGRVKKLAKARTVKLASAAKVKAVTTVRYAKANKAGGSKVKVSKAGKLTIKKGLAKGTYKVKVKLTASADANHAAATAKKITVTVKVK